MNAHTTNTPCCEGRCDNVAQVTDEVLERARRDALISAQAAANMRNLAAHVVHSIDTTGKSGREIQALALEAIRQIFVASPDED